MKTLQKLAQLATVILLSAALGACAAGQPEAAQAPRQLPTVTPVVPTEPPASSPTPPAPTRTIARPTATAAPPAAIVETAEGPLTPSMVELNIGAERYAALGDPAAPITLVEFSDYGCPSCRQFELATFPELKAAYIDTGKVYYLYKAFPVVSQHGGLAAEAAECAGEQGRYWEMHHQLFVTPQEWDAGEAEALLAFQGYAATIGIDQAQLAQCVAEGQQRAAIDADFAEGLALGIRGTPSFLINGKLLPGAQSLEIFTQVLDDELAQQP